MFVLKELIIFIIILILSAILIHPDLIGAINVRFDLMNEKLNYFHPFLYSFVIYLIVAILRIFIHFVKKVFTKG